MPLFTDNTVPNNKYLIDSDGRIRPTSPRDGIILWRKAKTFDVAIALIASSEVFQGYRDGAIPSDELKNQPDEWSGWLPIIQANKYLDVEEGFFLATGVIVPNACFQFEWKGDVFYNIRPNLCFLLLLETDGVGELPINMAELVICESLEEKCSMEIQAIQRAIQAGEIDPKKLYSAEWWREFWKQRKCFVLFDGIVTKADTPIALQDENSLPSSVDNSGRRKQQHEIILAVIAALEFDALQIPDGGKSKIKSACLTRPRLFTVSGFDHAWQEGVTAGFFRLVNHEKFSPK